MSNCICWFVFLLSRWRERLCTTEFYAAAASSFFFSVYLFSYSFCIHYHPPLCILTCHYYFLHTKDDLILSWFHLLSHIVRESLSTSHTSHNEVVVNVFFFTLLLFSLSLSLCRFLPASIRTREKKKYNKSAQRVDKLFYTLEYACVCSSSYEYAFFSLHTINFPLLYSIL